MAHTVDGFEIKFTARRSWKAEIRKGGRLVARAPVTWRDAVRRKPGSTEQFQQVWFSNPKELEAHRASREPFIAVIAAAKEPGKTPAAFRKFEKVVVVQSTGALKSVRSIETKILRRVTSRSYFPTKASVKAAVDEFESLKNDAFLEKYAKSRSPRSFYLLIENQSVPLKALWAAAHNPSALPRDFNTRDAIAGLKRLGYKNIFSIDASVAEQYEEGQRLSREATVLSRNSKLVSQAKAHYGTICMACGFDFGETYGSMGEGYIECHHLKPLAGRSGIAAPTKLAEVTVLCSNCHRMVHRQKTPLTVAELKAAIAGAAASTTNSRPAQRQRAVNKQRPGRKNAASGRGEHTRPIARLPVRSRATK